MIVHITWVDTFLGKIARESNSFHTMEHSQSFTKSTGQLVITSDLLSFPVYLVREALIVMVYVQCTWTVTCVTRSLYATVLLL